VNNKEEEEGKDESPVVTKQQVQTNSTVLSKQIKIVSQLNAKQINELISDRNTIKETSTTAGFELLILILLILSFNEFNNNKLIKKKTRLSSLPN
jgi:hypothetical protein